MSNPNYRSRGAVREAMGRGPYVVWTRTTSPLPATIVQLTVPDEWAGSRRWPRLAAAWLVLKWAFTVAVTDWS